MKRIIVYADFQLIVDGAWESSWSAVSRKGERYYQRIQTMDYQRYVGMRNSRHQVRAKKGFSMIGYTKMDLGIAKYHFEIGAGKEHFEWV